MRRRQALAGGAVAAASAAAGLIVFHRRDGSAPDAAASLWSHTFATPEGGQMTMQGLRGGKPLLLNFWATWCAPCVTEIPLLDAFASANAARWNTLALAIDDADKVRSFVAGRSLRLPLALAELDGLELSRALGNRANALPFTVVFDSAGAPAAHRLGRARRRLARSLASRHWLAG